MREKFYQNSDVIALMLFLCLIITGCTKSKKEKGDNNVTTDWFVSMNAPMYYYAYRPMVTVCYQGGILGGISTNFIGNNELRGWSSIDEGGLIVDRRHIPDSLFVEWSDYFDECRYEVGIKLPHMELNKLFKTKFRETVQGRVVEKYYNNINVGMAPGGNVCVFINHLELLRTKAICIGRDSIFNRKKKWKDTGILDILEYSKHHPLDTGNWEQPDPRYELDFGFCSEDGGYEVVFMYMTSIEGINNRIGYQSFKETNWMIPYGQSSNTKSGTYYITKNEINNDTTFKLQLPVHLKLSWQSKDETSLYCTDIVLPKNFQERFTKPYINPETGKKSNYNRLVFGVEKDGEHCIIWLDGSGKQEKLMRFKGHIAKRSESGGIKSGGYATEVVYFD